MGDKSGKSDRIGWLTLLGWGLAGVVGTVVGIVVIGGVIWVVATVVLNVTHALVGWPS